MTGSDCQRKMKKRKWRKASGYVEVGRARAHRVMLRSGKSDHEEGADLDLTGSHRHDLRSELNKKVRPLFCLPCEVSL